MSRLPHGMSRYDLLVKCEVEEHDEDVKNPARVKPLPRTFGRLVHPANPVEFMHITDQIVIDTLDKLATDMGKTKDLSGDAPAGMTFFGQFVDHDITLDATSELGKRIVPATIPNVRTPALDLDCVYGAGPEASPHLYGSNVKGGNDTSFMLVYGNGAQQHDLARTSNGTALIGDPRNDENSIVAQLQANMVALHNILMSWAVTKNDARAEMRHCAHMGMHENDWHENVPPASRKEIFEEVRRFIRLHYQYVVWTELLPAFVDTSILNAARAKPLFGDDAPVMPVEFSAAAYRFGHATAQHDYQLRKNEGQTELMDILGFGQRSAPIDMSMFFNIDGKSAQAARPVGTTLGLGMTQLPFIDEEMEIHNTDVTLTKAQSANLPLRNMIRDRYTFQLQNGEAIRDWMHSEHGLHARAVPVHKTLKDAGFTKTPLWFYCLQEAKEHGHGKLTGVGGSIVASVFAGLLRNDKTTYWHASGFAPSDMFANDGGVLAGMMKFVEKHRDAEIMHADDLKNG